MADRPEYHVKAADREVTPAFELNQIGKIAYGRAVDGDRYRTLELITAQLMCALTLEAVLNHVGQAVFVDRDGQPAVWNAVERLRPKDKLLAIAERVQLPLEFGQRPFQEFAPIFAFRRQLVHAKSLRLVTDVIPPEAIGSNDWLDERLVPGLQADWERSLAPATAQEWRDAVYGMAQALCSAADCSNPVEIDGGTGWTGEWARASGSS